jgi:hypothetical protein
VVALALDCFIKLLEGYVEAKAAYVRSSYDSDTVAIKMLDGIARSWYRSQERTMLMQHDPAQRLVEWTFDLPFMECEVRRSKRSKPEVIQVWLAGQADLLLLDRNRIWDWKSANQQYKRWEAQRWRPQQSVYTWAANEAGLLTPNKDGVIPFDYKVFMKGSGKPTDGPETISVFAGPGNWSFLRHKLFNLVNMQYQLGYDQPWPLDDMHVLCSPKWCGRWDVCKGLHVSPESWT